MSQADILSERLDRLAALKTHFSELSSLAESLHKLHLVVPTSLNESLTKTAIDITKLLEELK